MTDETPAAPPRNKGGRPPGSKNKGSAPPAAARGFVPLAPAVDPRAPIRSALRSPIRGLPAIAQGLTIDTMDDYSPFEIPAKLQDYFRENGYSVEWKRDTIYNAEDPTYQVKLANAHWQNVPNECIPPDCALMPQGHVGAVKKDGLALMMRPAYLTEEVKMRDKKRAREQMRAKEEQLGHTPPGTLTRDHATARPQIRTSVEPMEIPRD